MLSLKVGCPDESTQSLLSRYCLAPLSNQDGFLGNLLTSLYIYNRGWLNNNSIFNALRHCSNLTDLKIDGLIIYSLDDLIPFLTSKCQHLYLEKPKGSGGSSFGCATSFVTNCPNLASLSLIGFELSEKIACVLLKGLRKLKYLNLSRTVGVNGDFLRTLHVNGDYLTTGVTAILLAHQSSLWKSC
ncbi:unnamed protein product [Thlaspi arvense]|uniref:Uncharacterized protein n=1 Tax=Thlaspi arvense TaxID=13288 RepID=A0AAU9SW19_THLAR|nr:unnamed protein product [Thlaspi arvense]